VSWRLPPRTEPLERVRWARRLNIASSALVIPAFAVLAVAGELPWYWPVFLVAAQLYGLYVIDRVVKRAEADPPQPAAPAAIRRRVGLMLAFLAVYAASGTIAYIAGGFLAFVVYVLVALVGLQAVTMVVRARGRK
jgi:hypothetical protein